MLINPISFQITQKTSGHYIQNKLSFGSSQTEKKLVEFLASENLDKFKLTFEEAKSMCEYLGHTVETPRGSHARIHISGKRGILSLVIPHQSEKYISIVGKKKLIYLFTDRIRDAFRLR